MKESKKSTLQKGAKRIQSVPPTPHKEIKALLDGIPRDLPSLSRANWVTQRVSRVGFDWPDLTGVLKKLDEEWEELQQALSSKNRKRIREEIGDLLFVLVNLSRWIRIDPEDALNRTIDKFISRFKYIERSLRKKGKSVHQSDLTEMDALWEEAKGRG